MAKDAPPAGITALLHFDVHSLYRRLYQILTTGRSEINPVIGVTPMTDEEKAQLAKEVPTIQ